ncbi:hypothetical protein JAAARDRAFT_201555 [Jaapia argillacea MUCL 33604]|uniref:Cytochrome P450 n=1 Tax=Jaapia argillacea MUCL 33604 TaxID=933084 RepID=A0A067QB23_9AGAM|nr:hypothetical protein JAAARDRAFT_201555 [Jaapia argillacea MUCL 33604]
MDNFQPLYALVGVAVLYVVYRRFTRISLADIRGPEPENYLIGNMRQLQQGIAGVPDFEWTNAYGGIVHLKAPFGEDKLLVSDPKALQYILSTSGYNFTKSPDRRELTRILIGEGLIFVEGDDHKRHRKVMLPAFGGPESKALFPIFRSTVQQLMELWKDSISNDGGQSSVLNVPFWLGRATLDAIGEAAFDYKFGALDGSDSELGPAYNNLFSDAFALPSTLKIFIQSATKYIPIPVIRAAYNKLPVESLKRIRGTSDLANKVAKDLVETKGEALLHGKASRDVMTLLVKANASTNAKAQLSEIEMLSQMRTLMLAGHETSGNSLTWTLWELAKNPQMQSRLRDEIRSVERNVRQRGDTDFTLADIEGMSYLQAVLKESLRFNPVVLHMFREPLKDDVLPLFKPIMTYSGKLVHEVPIPAGTRLILSISAYNRDPDIWGPDSHTFNPDRWLTGHGKENNGPSIGVVGNLLTFSSGIRSCIGWRFAMVEMQTFLADLVNNFEFALTEESKKITRQAALVMVPMVGGKLDEGAQLPLAVSIAPRD